jgi:serine phosphatase RsbU (regulator of sigma subunit)
MSTALAMIDIQIENYKEALNLMITANDISQKLKLSKSIIYDEQVSIGFLYRKTGDYQKAFETLKPLENKILFEAYEDRLVERCYGELALTCKALNDIPNYTKYTSILEKRRIQKTEAEFQSQTQSFKETVNEQSKLIESKEKTISEKEVTLASYQDSLERAEILNRDIDLQLKLKEKDLTIKQNELERERLFNRSLTIGLVFLLVVIGIISYLTFIIKRASNEIKMQKEEIEKQNEMLEQKNSEISQQNSEINRQNSQITAGIRYAKNIQVAALPLMKEINKNFPAFVLYKPKDIVSGDFYWYAQKLNTKTNVIEYFAAVVDCTGHGVPGAFMSLIGMRMLNEILFQKNIDSPAQILTILNTELQGALKQSENSNDDGMDVAIVKIEKKKDNFMVTFCGANRPLIYFNNENNELIYQKGNLATIGGMEGKKFSEEFTDVKVLLNKKDMLYLTSDGYVDQNNSERKKFGTKKLQDTFQSIARNSVEMQLKVLEEELANHQLDNEQRDDITIMGISLV